MPPQVLGLPEADEATLADVRRRVERLARPLPWSASGRRPEPRGTRAAIVGLQGAIDLLRAGVSKGWGASAALH